MNKTLMANSLFFTFIALFATATQAIETKPNVQKADFLTTVDTNKDGKASKTEFITAMDKKFNRMDVDKSEAVSVQELKIYGEKDEQAKKTALQAAKQMADFEKMISKKQFLKLFTDRAELEFSLLDKNHDNELSADEAGAKKPKKKKNTQAKQGKKTMSKADFFTIFSQKAEFVFTKLDKNHDNKLANSELGIKHKTKTKPALPELPSLTPTVSSVKSNDKKLQQQQLINSFFVGIDADKDGKISSQEKNSLYERLFNRLDSNHDLLITQEEIIAGRHKPLMNNP